MNSIHCGFFSDQGGEIIAWISSEMLRKISVNEGNEYD